MGAATAITMEPLIKKPGCRLLSEFGLCQSTNQKMNSLEGTLHDLETQTVHFSDEENESVRVLASSSLKLQHDCKGVLNFTEDKCRRLRPLFDNLEQTVVILQQAQVCVVPPSVNFECVVLVVLRPDVREAN